MKIIAEIMFEMYAQRAKKKNIYPDDFFDVEKKFLSSLTKEQRKAFMEYETMLAKLSSMNK